MNCKTAEEYIFIYDMIKVTEKSELHGHLKSCSKCRIVFEERNQFSAMLGEIAHENIVPLDNERLTDLIMQRVITPKVNQGFTFNMFNILRLGMGAVSLSLLLLFVMETNRGPVAPNAKISEASAILQPMGKEVLRDRSDDFSLYAMINSKKQSLKF